MFQTLVPNLLKKWKLSSIKLICKHTHVWTVTGLAVKRITGSGRSKNKNSTNCWEHWTCHKWL